MTKDKEPTIPVRFKWTLLEAGQFKPATFVPLDETSIVCVNVPLKHEYIDNTEQIIQAQLQSDKVQPILSVEGVKFVFKQLNGAFSPDDIRPEDFTSEDKPVEEEW